MMQFDPIEIHETKFQAVHKKRDSIKGLLIQLVERVLASPTPEYKIV